jgi:hypothetical protein
MVFGRKFLGLLAVLADALVHDIRDLDGHRLGVFIPVRREAGRVPDGALHILNTAATDADGVVVVVPDPGLVQGGGVRRLKPAQHLQIGQVTEDHIHGLCGEFGEFGARRSQDAFRGGVRVMFDGGQNSHPLFGHPAAMGAQGGSPCFLAAEVFRHEYIEALIMNISQ